MVTTSLPPTRIRPNSRSFDLLLTTLTGLSHHDAAIQDDSNRTLFNRQKQLLAAPETVLATAVNWAALVEDFPVTADIADAFTDLTGPEFVATVLARLFLDFYNHGDGEGVFSGVERYARLETRVKQAAISAPTIRTWWDQITTILGVSIHPSDGDRNLLRLLAIPNAVGQQVLRTLAVDSRSIVALARLWHDALKLQDLTYAARAGRAVSGELVPVRLAVANPSDPTRPPLTEVVEVPTVSGNALRHQLVREPAWQHLAARLGLEPAAPGHGPLPPGVEALFYNGGNIAAGAKQPSDPYHLAWQIREHFPSLDLLGGVTDSFDLGESRLRVGSWLVCRENAAALAGTAAADLAAARVSVFELLDDVTLTRQAGSTGRGQMIWSFETLCPGTQILVRLTLTPFTPVLTQGALGAAVAWYLAEDGSVGGQASRGFGWVRGEWLTAPAILDAVEQYESYLDTQREPLVSLLIDGTLGCGQRILT